jgi:hypothetical protein
MERDYYLPQDTMMDNVNQGRQEFNTSQTELGVSNQNAHTSGQQNDQQGSTQATLDTDMQEAAPTFKVPRAP